jgi:hypothetical protein
MICLLVFIVKNVGLFYPVKLSNLPRHVVQILANVKLFNIQICI